MRHGEIWGRGVPGRQNGRSKSLIRCATKQERNTVSVEKRQVIRVERRQVPSCTGVRGPIKELG